MNRHSEKGAQRLDTLGDTGATHYGRPDNHSSRKHMRAGSRL